MTIGHRHDVSSEGLLNSPGHGRSLLNVSRNFVLFSQGSAADSVFYVRSGKIKMTVASSAGKGAVIALLGHGEFLGQSCLAGESRRMATAVTLTDCSVTRLDPEAMTVLLKTEPDFAVFFLERLLRRSIRSDEDLIDQLFNSSEKRLARALLLLANYWSDTPIEPVFPKISQETLAEMIGTTRSRVSFFMNKFRRLGYISYRAQLEVHASLLTVLVDEVVDASRDVAANGALPALAAQERGAAVRRGRSG